MESDEIYTYLVVLIFISLVGGIAQFEVNSLASNLLMNLGFTIFGGTLVALLFNRHLENRERKRWARVYDRNLREIQHRMAEILHDSALRVYQFTDTIENGGAAVEQYGGGVVGGKQPRKILPGFSSEEEQFKEVMQTLRRLCQNFPYPVAYVLQSGLEDTFRSIDKLSDVEGRFTFVPTANPEILDLLMDVRLKSEDLARYRSSSPTLDWLKKEEFVRKLQELRCLSEYNFPPPSFVVLVPMSKFLSKVYQLYSEVSRELKQ